MRVEVRLGAGVLSPDPVSRALLEGSAEPSLLPSLPRDDRAFAAAVGACARPAPAPALVDALVARQRALGAGRAAEEAADSLRRGALLVVAGQQPGLLGGPLLALHKAAGAIALARRFERESGRPVVPAFWVASEDHDWAEANRALVQCRDGGHRTLSLPIEGDLRSVRDVPVPEPASDALLAELEACLPPTERAAEASRAFRRPPGADLGEWFAVLLARLLGEAAGIVFVEPHVLEPWTGPVLARLVREADPARRALSVGASRLERAGVPPPLDPEPARAPLFLREVPRARRLRVSFDGDAVLLRGEPSGLSREALAERVAADPALGSADVLGRVLVQNSLLPTIAQVAGPAEIAYVAQSWPVHEVLGIPFPLAFPRPGATWVEARVERDLRAAGLGVAEVLAGTSAPKAPVDESAIAREIETIRARLVGLAAEATEPGASGIVEGLARASARAAERLSELHAESQGLGRARFEKARASLLPRGRPQERVLSPVSLVARHGVLALREGLGLLDPLALGHHLLHLDPD